MLSVWIAQTVAQRVALAHFVKKRKCARYNKIEEWEDKDEKTNETIFPKECMRNIVCCNGVDELVNTGADGLCSRAGCSERDGSSGTNNRTR